MLMTADEVISLLTDSNESDGEEALVSSTSTSNVNFAVAENQQQTISPAYRSCSLRAFNYMMSLDLGTFVDTYLYESESSMFAAIVQIVEVFPRSMDFLSVLLVRKWPKWHLLHIDDSADLMAIEALVSVGCLSTCASIQDWHAEQSDLFSLEPVFVLDDLPIVDKPRCFLDLLLHSLSPKLLSQLTDASKHSSLSRAGSIAKLKAAFDGTQRTIFGDRNDTSKLIKMISTRLELENSIALILSPTARRLFSTISFVLDIDAEEDAAWDMALPDTLLKTFANVSGGGRRSPSLTLGDSWSFEDVPSHLRLHACRTAVNEHRVICFLQDRVINRKLDAASVARNVRLALKRLKFDRSDLEKPEWWRRRQLLRRYSNLLWKCIAEIERAKQYEIAKDLLEFLLDHHEFLLGKKRLGKVLIRYMICCGHVSEDLGKVHSVVARFLQEQSNLYPADVAELTRRLSGVSINKFEWPCGGICEREVVIPGAKSRDINWVEHAAIEHYYVTNEGGYENGIHCEGRVMMEIFSSLFKESVLAPDSVSTDSGLLQSPLQKWSLDVGFLQECSDARWKDALNVIGGFSSLDYDALGDFYCTKYADKEDSSNDQLPVVEILKCMRGSVLGAIMRLMIADPYYWGGGQPDLIVWNTKTREVCFAEVKGPGDQLSPRQRWWLAHLRDAGATAEVCWVVDEPKPKTSRRKDELSDRQILKKGRKKRLASCHDSKDSNAGTQSITDTRAIIDLLTSSQE